MPGPLPASGSQRCSGISPASSMVTDSVRRVVTARCWHTSPRPIVPSLHPRCGWRTSTTTCPRTASPRSRSNPATRLVCSSTVGPGAPKHRHVADLPDLLREGDVVVVNETKVVPARLRLRRSTGGAAEVLLLEPATADRTTWEALIRPARRLHVGDVLAAPDGRPLVVVGERTAAGDTFRVELCGEPDRVLDDYGEVPLPPYIHTPLEDAERYQTVFARDPTSAAAPTAGLHLTPGAHRPDRDDGRGRRAGRAGRRPGHVPAGDRA